MVMDGGNTEGGCCGGGRGKKGLHGILKKKKRELCLCPTSHLAKFAKYRVVEVSVNLGSAGRIVLGLLDLDAQSATCPASLVDHDSEPQQLALQV